MTVPDWVQDAIFYQIFPDRFANGDRSNDPPNVQRWGSKPKAWNFMGGDLAGVIQKFDYLLDLGINALYFTPVFQSTSNHRYNATDYFKIDPKLGDLRVFQSLIHLAHDHKVKVILDGVFNHCGRGFFAFNDILENQQHSPYVKWFHILKFPVDAYSPGLASNYLGWWKNKSLPKFNTDNPEVRQYLLDVARYWIDQGADGWRLDVPNEIDDDSFWAEFRHVVKSANPEAYILGEIWKADPRWVGEDHFDGLMNYPVREAILELLGNGSTFVPGFIAKMEALAQTYPLQNLQAMYVLLGSHDTARLFTELGENLAKIKLALLIQFAFPGAPAIYYGDEIGLQGDKDPGCRGAFPWDERHWNQDLFSWVKALVSVRKSNVTLRRGEIKFLLLDDVQDVLVFVRQDTQGKVLITGNPTDHEIQVSLPVSSLGWEDGSQVHSLLSRQEYLVTQGTIHLSLSPWNGDWLT